MWSFQQHAPKPLRLNTVRDLPALTDPAPRIAIVTPSYNQRKYLEATVASVLDQNYPALSYHVQDGASRDGTVDLLNTYGGQISWRSEPDNGQANAINTGFKIAAVDCDIMAYLNSDDTLLPGTLSYIAHVFRPDQTSILCTDIDLYQLRMDRKLGGRFFRLTTPMLSCTLDTFRKRQCSGAATYGIR